MTRCVPCRFGTFPVLRGTPQEAAGLAPSVEVHMIEPGTRSQQGNDGGVHEPTRAESRSRASCPSRRRSSSRGWQPRHPARGASFGQAGRRACGDSTGADRRARSSGGVRRCRTRLEARAARARPDEAHVWVGRSSRRTRSWRATSLRDSGASRSSPSSWRSGRSCRGQSRAPVRSRRSRTRTRATGRKGSRCSGRGAPRRRPWTS